MTDIELLRHTLATLAYRAAKTIRHAPESFANFSAGPGLRTPVEIVAHMADLFDWALSMAVGDPRWNDSPAQSWAHESGRFFDSLKRFDDYLVSGMPLHHDHARLFQGPVADALTHTGQLAMLRHLAACKMKGESYNRADIQIGRVTIEQTPPDPRYEFD
ncbi:MAG: hypothetical protein AB1752_08870 [Candidatus Zixiibacteriota bacterium]